MAEHVVEGDRFEYSQDFREMIITLHRGKENWPDYNSYIRDHLGGCDSRLQQFFRYLYPEIVYHCGDLKDKTVLDFGCGTGASTVVLATYAREVVAFDIDRESIDICKQRIKEHGMMDRVTFYCNRDIEEIIDLIGALHPYVILMNGVLEHIPLSIVGLRKKTMLSLFSLLSPGGYLFITDTPNRLFPLDFHSTHLWWIPWTKPGSRWAYSRAVRMKRYSDAPTLPKGPLGLEVTGAWGATYFEIRRYLSTQSFRCLNTIHGHDRYMYYLKLQKNHAIFESAIFESLVYYMITKWFHIPITAFTPCLTNLVIQKC